MTTVYWCTLPGDTALHVTYDQRYTLCGLAIPSLRFDGSCHVDILEGSQVRVGVPICRGCYRCT